jgi:predicted flap endonuclease-1-like 5' DNA nuclease
MIYSAFFEPERWVPKDNENPFEYWASLAPTAPLFGVRWRFADDLPQSASLKVARATEATTNAVVEAFEQVIDGMAKPTSLYSAEPKSVDDLKRIKGIGPKLENLLNAMGIYSFEQISKFSEENLAWVDSQLTAFKGRPMRDDWIAQATKLNSNTS